VAGFEGYAGEYRGEVDVRASIILGEDPSVESRSFDMHGFVRIKEWPLEGYERRTLDDGRVQIDLEMVESQITAEIEEFGSEIRITETTADRNLGTLTQVTAGEDFPAEFALARLVSVDTPIGRLHNEEPIQIRATIDSIPPVATRESREGMNVFEAVNTPVPLLDEQNKVVAHFSGDPAEHTNCNVLMRSAE
jgi:hypothetical protein